MAIVYDYMTTKSPKPPDESGRWRLAFVVCDYAHRRGRDGEEYEHREHTYIWEHASQERGG